MKREESRGRTGRWRVAAGALLLGLAVWGVYGQTRGHGWVAWDDNGYICENAMVKRGLTWAGAKWAWRTEEMTNWHPLTWLSLMLDRELFGDWPGGGHLESAALHWANALLLWWVVGRLTGRKKLGWWVALLWAVHPLRVESVAWASERKDVLAALFGLAAVGTYAGGRGEATKRRDDETTSGEAGGMGRWRMRGVAGWMAASLLCKPTLVTLPCLLLLLDGWPLRRWGRVPWRELAEEKWMLWGLAAASCAMTLSAQRTSMASVAAVGAAERAATALTGYGWYLTKWVWPAGLAFFYPREWAGVTCAGAAAWGAALAAASAGAVWAWRKKGLGGAGAGWFWFLGTLVPMIGLVQVGRQVWADRYSYWPEMGLWLAAATLAAAVLEAKPRAWRRAAAAAGAAAALALGWAAREQAGAWRNGQELVSRGVAVTGDHVIAERVWGEECYRKGDWAGAASHWERATRMDPAHVEAWSQLGMARYAAGDHAGAREAWEKAAATAPGQWMAMNNLAWVCLEEGEISEARKWIDRALEHAGAQASDGVRDTEAAVRAAEAAERGATGDPRGAEGDPGEAGGGQWDGMRE